ncbi:MAG: tetratricopeptide repeat protein [Sphingomonadaceae bacterium]|nr:tetratricopeptide repeat protein [Sphingomonadaceae bacterium]
MKTNGKTPELQFLNGRIALEDENPELAKSEFSELLDHPEFGAESRIYLAQAHLMGGNSKLALETLGQASLSSGLAAAVAVGAYLAEGNSDKAVTMLDQGLKTFPDTPELLILDGTRSLQLGDAVKAGKIGERAASLAPNDADVALFQAKVALQKRDFPAANAHFDRALELRPASQVALLGKAAVAYDNGQRDEALKWLKNASEKLGGAGAPMILLNAQIAFDDGQYDEANRIIQKIKDYNAFPEAYRMAGLIAAKRGQKEQARAHLTGYFRRGGENLAARAMLSSLLYETGQYREAWSYLKPIADAPNANPQILTLAHAVTTKLSLPAVATYQARAQKLAKGDPNAEQMVAAEKAIRTGKWGDAERIYADLLSNPANAADVVIVNNYANVLMETGKHGQAVKYARKAHQLAPANPTVQDTLGWAMFKAEGFSPEALKHISAALEAQPNNDNIRSHYLALAAASSTQAN